MLPSDWLQMTYTSDGARELSIKQRGCVFPDELPLRVAPIYTFSSCMRECRMEKLMELCGCLPIFYTLLRKGLIHRVGSSVVA